MNKIKHFYIYMNNLKKIIIYNIGVFFLVYIDFINDEEKLVEEKEKKCCDFFKKIFTYYRKRTNFVLINQTEFGELIQIQNNNNITISKLKKILEINSVKSACLSAKVDGNEKIYKILNENNIKIINGDNLKKYLLGKVIEFICNKKSESLYQQEISFFVKKNSFLVSCIISDITKNVKNVNIITQNPGQFNRLEKNLYEKEGIVLNITNNYKKSLINSNIIVNIDFSSEEINKYIIPRYCCLINLEKDYVTINKKSFEGINISNLKYSVSERYVEGKLKNFDKEIFYESIVIRNSNPENILKRIKKDNVKVIELYGRNGIISKKEFEKLKRKIIS